MPYLYAVMLREFVKSGESVIKIGRSKNPDQRIKSYSKGSVELARILVSDEMEAKAALIKVMDACHTQCQEYGREYYRGDFNSMMASFFLVGAKYGRQPLLDQSYDEGQNLKPSDYEGTDTTTDDGPDNKPNINNDDTNTKPNRDESG
jgi:hypothetical protein